MFVPNFKILSQVVAEKSLTEKKFTDRQTNTQILGQKRQNYIPPIYFVYRGFNESSEIRTHLAYRDNAKLELMFMKHYAPNRCLHVYIKVANLRTGMGSAEMSHLQNCSLKIYLKRALGGGSGWGVRMDVKEELKFS